MQSLTSDEICALDLGIVDGEAGVKRIHHKGQIIAHCLDRYARMIQAAPNAFHCLREGSKSLASIVASIEDITDSHPGMHSVCVGLLEVAAAFEAILFVGAEGFDAFNERHEAGKAWVPQSQPAQSSNGLTTLPKALTDLLGQPKP